MESLAEVGARLGEEKNTSYDSPEENSDIKNDSSEMHNATDMMHTEQIGTLQVMDFQKECKFYPSVVERYFSQYYSMNIPALGFATLPFSEQNHVRVLMHSNKLCIITLAPSHPSLTSKSGIKSVSFRVTDKCDRSRNVVSGKRKRGAQWLNPESPLCIVTTNDDVAYTVRSGIRGNLVEVNEKLVENPALLKEKHDTDGYIAVVMIKLDERAQTIEGLMDKTEYENNCASGVTS